MLRILPLLLLMPALAAAQTSTTKPAAPAPKPAAAAPAAPKPTGSAPATTAPARRATGTAAPATRRPAASTAKPAAPPAPAAMTDEEKTVYALGLLLSRSLRTFDLSVAELDIVSRALRDATNGTPAVEIEEWGPKVEPLAGTRGERVRTREKAASAAYLAKAAMAAGAVKTDSGLVYADVSVGTGASPKASDVVKVHYRGTLTNGTEFDSSYSRNEPAEFPLEGVIKCWTEGVQRMKVGGKARLVCPSDLAYGDQGNPAIPGGAALVFEVELLDIVANPAPPQMPQMPVN